MSYRRYTWCLVPNCRNTSIKTPEKLFIKLPDDLKRRQNWLRLARRDPNGLSSKSLLYLCEDHFDLEKDMMNYMEYKIMGRVKLIRMKPDCVPTKFNFQSERKHTLTPSFPLPAVIKTERLSLDQETENNINENWVKSASSSYESEFPDVVKLEPDCIHATFEPEPEKNSMLTSSSPQSVVVKMERLSSDQETESENEGWVESTSSAHKQDFPTVQNIPSDDGNKADIACQTNYFEGKEFKAVQTYNLIHYRSKLVQNTPKMRDRSTSTINSTKSIGTSTHMSIVQNGTQNAKIMESTPSFIRISKRKQSFIGVKERSDSDISYTLSEAGSTSQDSLPHKYQTNISLSNNGLQEELQSEDQNLNLQCTLSKIKRKPHLYIGISKQFYFLIDLIQKHTQISEQDILLCLKKIRLNTPFFELADDFGLSLVQTRKIFLNKLPLIASVLAPFIKTFSSESIKKNLPIAFRHKYHNITNIIDCLEIIIQKPKTPIYQALTWSVYKRAHTVKYLISYTPNGLINFISIGYGGHITDVQLVKESKFLETLKPGACVLVFRGFKHIEQCATQMGFTVIRPQSIASSSKLTEAWQNSRTASLRIHVKKVIRRLRLFDMLKPHSVINVKLIPVLDLCVITACALVNLQDTVI